MIDIKQKKREAADFLSRKGRRIEFIFFGLLLIFVTIVPFYLYAYIKYLFLEIFKSVEQIYKFTDMQTEIILLILLMIDVACAVIFAVFVTFPVYSCFFDFSYKIYRDGARGKQRYLACGKRGYWKACGSGCVIVVTFALSIAPVIALVMLGKYFATFDDERFVALVNNLFFIVLAIGFVAGFLIFIFFKPFFLFGYYIAKGKNVIEALTLSDKQMKNPRANEIYFAYIKSFIPSLLLSLATFLILFIVDTLPKMMTVYFDVAEDIAYVEQ